MSWAVAWTSSGQAAVMKVRELVERAGYRIGFQVMVSLQLTAGLSSSTCLENCIQAELSSLYWKAVAGVEVKVGKGM
ncbi:hypothetical protein KEJ39_05240 [Candidatus Bathyarchaeota archaeon]|nr:hypothetical protein [Candidatus Bathyarchaeota archaeon]